MPDEFRWYPRIIAATCRFYHDCVYVEIGTGRGIALGEIAPACAEVHGVDVRPESDVDVPEGARFWNMPSDDFFSAYDGSSPHVIFIDGDHSYEQARRDFENALRLLRPGGIVFMHDTWPRDERDATDEFCGGVWKLAEELSESAEVESFTWPAFPGLTVVRRRGEGLGRGHLRERG
jgi:methyltransferase family protein